MNSLQTLSLAQRRGGRKALALCQRLVDRGDDDIHVRLGERRLVTSPNLSRLRQ